MGSAMPCRWIAAAILGIAVTIPLEAHAQGTPIVMKIGTATINDAQHEWMKRFAALVEQDSKGRIKGEVYPASQLGSIPRMIEQTQFGSAQAWVGPAEFLSGVDMRYQILSAPGVFKDMPHANRVLQDPKFNAAFLSLGANKGLKGVGLFLSGPTSFVTRKPVHDMAGFEGMKIRVLSAPIQMEQIRALGAVPVPMSLGEVLPALQQGALDSVMSDAPIFAAMRYYSVARYQIETEHSMILSIAVVSKTWYAGLPADLQKIVDDDARRISEGLYQFSLDEEKRALDEWTKAGGEVIRFAPAEQQRLMERLRPIGAEVTAKKPDEKAMYELLVETAKRTE